MYFNPLPVPQLLKPNCPSLGHWNIKDPKSFYYYPSEFVSLLCYDIASDSSSVYCVQDVESATFPKNPCILLEKHDFREHYEDLGILLNHRF